MNAPPIDRSAWDEVATAFSEFFDGIGTVHITDDGAAFEANGTGFSIRRDGTSRSFMPLHDLTSQWDQIRFDHEAHEVELISDSGRYLYRVPQRLIDQR